MVRITIEGEELDLNEGFTLSIEETSPIFSDAGSQAIDITIPATARNKRILGFPARVDNSRRGIATGIRCMVAAGAYIRTGSVNIADASDTGISINIGFENSIAYEAWKSRRLKDIECLPVYRFRDMAAVGTRLKGLYGSSDPQEDDLAVFPICLAKKEWKSTRSGNEVEANDYYIINRLADNMFREGKFTKYRCIDGKAFMMSYPAGYTCSPFVRVWKILECVFRDLGLEMERNMFREDIALARLVVLNNTEDAVCDKTLDYAELMPDCSIEEFLNALHVRFGFVYSVDFDSGTVRTGLVREIPGRPSQLTLDPLVTSKPVSGFVTPQYVALCAGTSMEGAETAADRFEDFIGDYGTEDIFRVGESLRNSEAFETEVDKRLKEITDRDNNAAVETPGDVQFPDGADCIPAEREKRRVAKEFLYCWSATSGEWERFCNERGRQIVEESSSFFVWDPQPDGLDKNGLTSVDEFCPVRGIDPLEFTNAVAGNEDYRGSVEYMPTFFAAPRHFHTDKYHGEEETEGECPLSFMFAFTGTQIAENTIGRNSPDRGEGEDALAMGGEVHPYSLYFQFKNGLYSIFWRDYDMIMRVRDRRVKVPARLKSVVARGINVLDPVKLHGVPMLIENMDFTLGKGDMVDVDFTLVPIMPPVDFANPEIPDFP